jgi:hypothetical protein
MMSGSKSSSSSSLSLLKTIISTSFYNNLVVTYAQLDSNIRVLYVFFVIFKKYGPKYAEWYKKEEENRASS